MKKSKKPSSPTQLSTNTKLNHDYWRKANSSASQSANDNFGGLILGFTGKDSAVAPNEMLHQNLMFTPGINLGPEYPDDLRMTSQCHPMRRRGRREDVESIPSVSAVFSPPLPKPETKNKLQETPKYPHPCDCLPECVGEDDDVYIPPNNLFVFFGQTESIRPSYCPPVFQTSDEDVFEYFDANNIDALIEYFVTLICLKLPSDPFEYIHLLCDQMIKSRTDEAEFDILDTIFNSGHAMALFSKLDKQERKFVTAKQYKTAMETLGITRYNLYPKGYAQNTIMEEDFLKEVTMALEFFMTSLIS